MVSEIDHVTLQSVETRIEQLSRWEFKEAPNKCIGSSRDAIVNYFYVQMKNLAAGVIVTRDNLTFGKYELLSDTWKQRENRMLETRLFRDHGKLNGSEFQDPKLYTYS